MLGFRNNLADHSLNNTNIAIQETPNGSSDQCYPNVTGKSNHNHAQDRAEASYQQDRSSAYSVRKRAPVHAGHRLRQRKG